MKKAIVILLILAVGLTLLVGCKPTGDDGEQNDEVFYLSLGETVNTVTVLKDGDYLPYQVTGEDVGVLLDELGEIAYTEAAELTDDEVALLSVKYTIRGSGILILVCDGDFVICRQDEGNTLCEIVDGDFLFLDEYDYKPAPKKLSVLVGYGEEPESVVFYDAAKGLTLDLSANTKLCELLLSVECDVTTASAEAVEKYALTVGGKAFSVNTDGSISFVNAEGEACRAMPTGDGLDYLDTLVEGEATALGGYDAEAEIRVYNSQSRYATVTDNAELLSAIGAVALIKLTNAEHYSLGKAEYTVKVGENTIYVYSNYVKTADGTYAIISGDFAFLGELSFDNYDSGNLPWI